MIRKRVMPAMGESSTYTVKNFCREGESNSSTDMRKNSPYPTNEQIEEEWYNAYHDTIYRKIYNHLWKNGVKSVRTEAEDLTHDVYMRAHRSLQRGKGPKISTENWLKKIADNVCKDFFSKNTEQLKAVSLEQSISNEDEKLSLINVLAEDEENCPEWQAEQHERVRTLYEELVATLTPEERRAILLVEIEGWTLEQVSRVYPGRALSTVAEDRKKGLEKLRVRLGHMQN